MFDEEESKKLRILQRHQRLELQLIVERCNEVCFDYVCVPSVRNDQDLCFGSKTPRKIYLFADDKKVNSFMRKCFKEHFPKTENVVDIVKADDEAHDEEIAVKSSHTFASRVPRFNEISSSGVYRRRKKTKQAPEVEKKEFCAFGSSNERSFLICRSPVESISPGVGSYNIVKSKRNFFSHSFNGDIIIKPAYEMICTPINFDTKCLSCDQIPKNIYWKHDKAILCRPCYSKKLAEIKQNTRGVIDRLRKIKKMEVDFLKKRYCEFYHQHNTTIAAVRLLSPKEFHKRIHQENCLAMKFEY